MALWALIDVRSLRLADSEQLMGCTLFATPAQNLKLSQAVAGLSIDPSGGSDNIG
jgi:hypothetical protein